MRVDFHTNIQEIVIVGVGGTGASVARSTARIVYDMKTRGLHVPHMTLVDGDQIEARNVGRQLFAPGDIGQFKSIVVAQRLNYTFGLDIQAIPEMFEANRHSPRYGALIIGAVDNHLARSQMARAKGLWLDCGNHADSGQVILGSSDSREAVLRAFEDATEVVNQLPNATLTFPALLEAEAPKPVPEGPLSCAQAVMAGEQHLLVNDMMAVAASGYVYNLLNKRPITSWMTFIDIGAGFAMRPVPISKANILAYLGQN